jgi:DNA-binding transcriptional regulator YhcF (GntR family)
MMWMEWTFHDEAPIYLQIMEQIKRQIATGLLNPGDKIPAVRELAIEAGVNPNTMQKALSELEREGLLYSQRTSGRFVSDNSEDTRNLQQELVVQYMQTFMMNMTKMGYSPKQSAESYMEYVNEFSDKM